MAIDIRQAEHGDVPWIGEVHRTTSRPRRDPIDPLHYLVAVIDGELVGCAGIDLIAGGGYLYGLAVLKSHRRQGIGTALTEARVERVRNHDGDFALALAMFWNVRFFRNLGFTTFPRKELPANVLEIPDLSNPMYRRSAVLLRGLGARWI